MKTSYLFLSLAILLFLDTSSLQAQTLASTQTKAVDKVGKNNTKRTTKSKVPALNFALGIQRATFKNLESYITENLQYPDLAKKHAIEGSVKILVQISPEGKTTPSKIIQSLGFGCDEAALNLIKNMPFWVPATNYGNAVQDKRILEFRFKLQ